MSRPISIPTLNSAAPQLTAREGVFDGYEEKQLPDGDLVTVDTLPGDTCLIFTEPTLDAWKIDYRLIAEPSQFDEIGAHWTACRDAAVPGAILLAEGKA